jgi:hypothetical protein
MEFCVPSQKGKKNLTGTSQSDRNSITVLINLGIAIQIKQPEEKCATNLADRVLMYVSSLIGHNE